MKKMLPILVPGVVAGVLVSAMVLAAPLPETAKGQQLDMMNRAAAYRLAMAD